MKTLIFTDTGADCLQHEIESLDINIIELPVTFDGEYTPCRNSDEFWQKLISGMVARTSQPSPEALRQHFEQAKQNQTAIVYVTISSRLSGTYETAVAIKEEVGYDEIYVVDSLNATTAEKMLVLEACQLRNQGVDACEIAQKLNQLKYKIKIYACLDTLKYLARGGRISKSTATIGTLANIKPMITFADGEVHNYSKSIGITLAIRKMVDVMLSDDIDTKYPPIPIYAYDSKNCENFVNQANNKGINIDSKLITPIGATIATHIGPGGVGVVYVVK